MLFLLFWLNIKVQVHHKTLKFENNNPNNYRWIRLCNNNLSVQNSQSYIKKCVITIILNSLQ